MKQVLAIDLPAPYIGFRNPQELTLYERMAQRVGEIPGVRGVALASFVPWRDVGGLIPYFGFTVEGFTPPHGEENPHGRLRMVSPNYFAVIGLPLIAGRDFTPDDRAGAEPVAIISQSIARQLLPGRDVVNRKLTWVDPLFSTSKPMRIVGVVADVDDESVVPGAAMTVYEPVRQMNVAGRLFVHADGDPYALMPTVTRVVREISADQPVERAATLQDVRAEVLAPERLNAFVLSGFAGVALLIAVVGVGGVLAFSVSARTREFGVRLAIGSTRRRLLVRILSEGAAIVAIGIGTGAAGGYAFAFIAARYVDTLHLPGTAPIAVAALILATAAILASLIPAARASRVDVLEALRSE
jgi:putative ABC transport system permease protein